MPRTIMASHSARRVGCLPRDRPKRARLGSGRRVQRSQSKLFSIKTFRYVALAEATSFLILLVVAYVVHSEGGVNVMGPLHGTLFLAYVVIALAVARAAGWTAKQTILV